VAIFRAEDGNSVFLRNVGFYLPTPHGVTIQKNSIDMFLNFVQCVQEGKRPLERPRHGGGI
jgi:hypothetical protein